MKCLVTGSNGFIGSNLVDKLVSLGYEVIGIDNQSSKYNSVFYLNDQAKYYNVNICNYEEILPLFKDIDYVFHLASDARIQESVKNAKKSIDVNVYGTFNILEAAKENKVKRVIISSTSSLYGNNPVPHIETQKEDPLSPYSVSKLFAEKLAKIYWNLYGLETISLRYFGVYGDRAPDKGELATVITLFNNLKKNGKPLTVVGDGLQKREFTNVSDIVDANILAAETKIDKKWIGLMFNVGTGINYSIKDIVKMFNHNYVYIPKRPGEANESLSDSSLFKNVFNWNPKINLEQWIKDNIN